MVQDDFVFTIGWEAEGQSVSTVADGEKSNALARYRLLDEQPKHGGVDLSGGIARTCGTHPERSRGHCSSPENRIGICRLNDNRSILFDRAYP